MLNALVIHSNTSEHNIDLINANMIRKKKDSLRKCIESAILDNKHKTRIIHNITNHHNSSTMQYKVDRP